MPRFFADEPPVNGEIIITGEDARHIGRSLRMAVGEEITVCRGGSDYICRLEKISDSAVIAKVITEEKSKEPSISLTLFQAMPKTDKLELIVQKAVELGAVRIVPVMTRRCISRPEKSQFEKKRERLQKIALEAAKQSGRGIIPEVSGIISFEKCIEEMRALDLGLMCYEKFSGSLNSMRLSELKYPVGGSVGLLVGSEGGFDAAEAEAAVTAGIKPIWLGDRILRCETAPLAAISVIMSLTGNI